MQSFKTFPPFLIVLFALHSAQGASISLGPVGSGQSISGSSITYTTNLVQGGTSPASNHLGTGTVTNTGVGGTYDGTFFSPSVNSDSSLTTRIGSSNREQIDNGNNNQFGNYVGIHVQFSLPINIYTFGLIDLDGGEWAGSYAYNSVTTTTIAPEVTLGVGAPTLQLTPTTAVNWGGTGAPSTSQVARDIAGGNRDPSNANSQVLFDYDGEEITDIYIFLGVAANVNSTTVNNSGVTGLTLINPVPEPSSSLLLILSTIALCGMRRRH